MRILLTGGGTGGHFYPVISIAEELNLISKENRLLRPEIYFMSTESYNEGLLFENNITFIKIKAGKIRKNFSIENLILNFFDLFKTGWGVLSAFWKLFWIYPDVVVGKGGYVSFPALFVARLLLIPVVIHESDSIPGKVNRWAGKFARKIAISYPEAIKYFDKTKTAYTGNPIRKDIKEPGVEAHHFFGFKKETPSIFIIGGSQGAKFINDVIMDALPELVKRYQVVHQVGKNNLKIIEETVNVILQKNEHKDRYKLFAYLNLVHLRMAAGVADIIISRAGSTIFEIASWGKPSIIIPIPEPTSHDQRSNAYAYARSGASVVIEEKNLAEGVLVSEIERITSNVDEKERMKNAALGFSRRDAAKLIANEIIEIALEHEK